MERKWEKRTDRKMEMMIIIAPNPRAHKGGREVEGNGEDQSICREREA